MNIVTRNWRDLIRPRGIQVEAETLTEFYGKFTCEPLERGFGITPGQLPPSRSSRLAPGHGDHRRPHRRRAPRVHHDRRRRRRRDRHCLELEGSRPQVGDRQDVLRPKSTKKASRRGLREGHPAAVDGLQVLNQDHLIATLDKKGPLSMELTVNVGRGYVPADKNKTPTMAIGTIPIDSLFAPVRKVNYTVTNARVGQSTDYDKLSLEVWTNGSVKPQGRGRLRREDPERAALDLHQLRRDRRDDLRRRRWRGRAAEREPLPLGRTSWSSRSAARTACRTRTSRSSASWFSAPSRTCSRRRTSAGNR